MSGLMDTRRRLSNAQKLAVALLALITIGVYARTLNNGFVYYDDGLYVFDNVHVRDGISIAGLKQIFITGETGTWQPIALLSHMIDSQLFGLRPWGHHLTAILLHAANAVLIVFVLFRTTGRFVPSLVVAAIFALHPAHVESVAWVSERKDVLSTMFWMLCLIAYERYVRASGTGRFAPQYKPARIPYAVLLVLFVLGLMTKPMLVTLPCVLLLFDYWPLRRQKRLVCKAGILEKLPLFLLVVASCVITIIVQRQNQAIVTLENLPLDTRLANVVVSYVKYIWIMFWPVGLGIDYAHPKDTIPAWQIGGGIAVILSVSIAALILRQRAPYFLVGWFWYLGTLVPVIGIVHVGEQGMADRYTYVPTIGLSIAFVWACDALLARVPNQAVARRGVTAAVAVVFTAYAIGTWQQIAHWKDTKTLWARAVAVNPSNERAQRNLGAVYLEEQRYAEAAAAFSAALSVNPVDPRSWHNLAFASQQQGFVPLALEQYAKALQFDSENADTRNAYGFCLLLLDRNAEAAEALREALRLNPNDPEAASNLGVALCKLNRVDEAVEILLEAVRRNESVAKLRNNLGIAFNMQGKPEEAVRQFREALRIDPSYDEARRNLQVLGVSSEG
ncbi:MAG TPA: tetratricopeptide repeat protein [Candidatus Hydrogenedentes bacterium]|nr:tetratricopeptide repeat protein [Candidatus Hydrogenedentota bacterium]